MVFGLDLEDGDVLGGVEADEGRLVHAVIEQRHRELGRLDPGGTVGHRDVAVGDDVALVVPDESRAGAGGDLVGSQREVLDDRFLGHEDGGRRGGGEHVYRVVLVLGARSGGRRLDLRGGTCGGVDDRRRDGRVTGIDREGGLDVGGRRTIVGGLGILLCVFLGLGLVLVLALVRVGGLVAVLVGQEIASEGRREEQTNEGEGAHWAGTKKGVFVRHETNLQGGHAAHGRPRHG